MFFFSFFWRCVGYPSIVGGGLMLNSILIQNLNILLHWHDSWCSTIHIDHYSIKKFFIADHFFIVDYISFFGVRLVFYHQNIISNINRKITNRDLFFQKKKKKLIEICLPCMI